MLGALSVYMTSFAPRAKAALFDVTPLSGKAGAA
jgi:hypothetical protein